MDLSSNHLTTVEAADILAVRVRMYAPREKRAGIEDITKMLNSAATNTGGYLSNAWNNFDRTDPGHLALLGGGVGLGGGVLATMLSKRKKKRYMRNAILGALLGAGLGGAYGGLQKGFGSLDEDTESGAELDRAKQMELFIQGKGKHPDVIAAEAAAAANGEPVPEAEGPPGVAAPKTRSGVPVTPEAGGAQELALGLQNPNMQDIKAKYDAEQLRLEAAGKPQMPPLSETNKSFAPEEIAALVDAGRWSEVFTRTGEHLWDDAKTDPAGSAVRIGGGAAIGRTLGRGADELNRMRRQRHADRAAANTADPRSSAAKVRDVARDGKTLPKTLVEEINKSPDAKRTDTPRRRVPIPGSGRAIDAGKAGLDKAKSVFEAARDKHRARQAARPPAGPVLAPAGAGAPAPPATPAPATPAAKPGSAKVHPMDGKGKSKARGPGRPAGLQPPPTSNLPWGANKPVPEPRGAAAEQSRSAASPVNPDPNPLGDKWKPKPAPTPKPPAGATPARQPGPTLDQIIDRGQRTTTTDGDGDGDAKPKSKNVKIPIPFTRQARPTSVGKGPIRGVDTGPHAAAIDAAAAAQHKAGQKPAEKLKAGKGGRRAGTALGAAAGAFKPWFAPTNKPVTVRGD